MVSTRRGRSSSPEECDSPVPEDPQTAKTSKIPLSDPKYAVKIVIAEDKKDMSLSMHLLRNPKCGSPVLYVISDDSCSEVVQVGGEHRSWFYGNDVVEDGCFRMYSPVHPLFIALPYFYKQKGKFVELEEILADEDVKAVELLRTNKQLLNALNSISDNKDICDTVVYRFNEEKTLEWIRGRLQKVKGALVAEGSLHKSITSSDEVLHRFCFGVLSDFLQPELAVLAKDHLGIKEAVMADGEKIEMPYKRKAEDEYASPSQPAAKKPRESVVKKQLATASKGTKSISSFFGKK